MNKLIAFALLATALGACATVRDAVVQDPEEQLSPAALVGTQTARCDRDSRLAINTMSSIPSTGVMPYGNSDAARDINRSIYWKCAKELWPPAR